MIYQAMFGGCGGESQLQVLSHDSGGHEIVECPTSPYYATSWYEVSLGWIVEYGVEEETTFLVDLQ